jgi:hypothetical protein
VSECECCECVARALCVVLCSGVCFVVVFCDVLYVCCVGDVFLRVLCRVFCVCVCFMSCVMCGVLCRVVVCVRVRCVVFCAVLCRAVRGGWVGCS